jgi:hypothetical protein
VGGDVFGDALAAAQSGGDQVVGVAAVDLGAGRAAGGAPIVAADEELSGREVGRVEVVQDAADLAGAGVDGVLGAVAVEPDGVGAAAQSRELAEDTRQGAVLGEPCEFRERGRGGAGEDGFSPSGWIGQEDGLPGRRMLGGVRPPREPCAVSAPVLVAEQGAQGHGGYGHGDGRDGDGGQERGEDHPAHDHGDDRPGADRERRKQAPYGRRAGGRVGMGGRRRGAVGVLGQEHGGTLLIYSSRHVSR